MSCCLWVLLGSLNQNALSLSSAPCHLNWSALDCSWPLYCPSICIDTVSDNNRKSRTGSSCRPVHPVFLALSQRQFVGGQRTVTVTVLGNINLVPLFIPEYSCFHRECSQGQRPVSCWGKGTLLYGHWGLDFQESGHRTGSEYLFPGGY